MLSENQLELNKAQGEVSRNELVSHGAHVSDPEGEHAKQSVTEVEDERK
jgi:hypothetical protein